MLSTLQTGLHILASLQVGVLCVCQESNFLLRKYDALILHEILTPFSVEDSFALPFTSLAVSSN